MDKIYFVIVGAFKINEEPLTLEAAEQIAEEYSNFGDDVEILTAEEE